MLAVRAGALGDTLLALPALGALRGAVGPRGRVEFLGRLPQATLACGERYATAVHDFERALFRGFFESGTPHDDAELRRFLGSFDLVVAWARLPRLAEVASCPILSADPRPPEGKHASEHLADLLRQGGLEVDLGPSVGGRLELGEDARREADAFCRASSLAPPFVAIHPSSGSPDKNWHTMYFRDLAALVTRSGRTVVWVEGEADGAIVAPLQEAVPGVLAKGLSLGGLGALLSRSSLYVGNDSGVTHLAAGCGAPTIAIFRSTDPERWAPRGNVIVVEGHLSARDVWGIARDRYALH